MLKYLKNIDNYQKQLYYHPVSYFVLYGPRIWRIVMDVVLGFAEKLMDYQFALGFLFGIAICCAVVFYQLRLKAKKTSSLDRGIDLEKCATFPKNSPSPDEVWTLIEELARLRDDLAKQQDTARLERRLCVLLEIESHLGEESFSKVTETWRNGLSSEQDEDEFTETPAKPFNREGLLFYCRGCITDIQCQLGIRKFYD